MEIIAPLITITAVVLLIVSLCWPSPRARRVPAPHPTEVSGETPPGEELDEPDEPTLVQCIEDPWGTSAWTIEPRLACADSGTWERDAWTED